MKKGGGTGTSEKTKNQALSGPGGRENDTKIGEKRGKVHMICKRKEKTQKKEGRNQRPGVKKKTTGLEGRHYCESDGVGQIEGGEVGLGTEKNLGVKKKERA